MPRLGSAHRAEQVALLARMTHEMLTAPEVGELLEKVDNSEFIQSDEGIRANVREIRRSYNRAVKIPKELIEEIARVATRSQQVWQEAREADDFAAFRPWLEKIVALKRQEAQAIGYRQAAYDALLDEYEPGATTAEITEIFSALRKALVPMVQSVIDSGRKPKRDILEREFPIEEQESFSRAAAAAIGYNFEGGRLDVTAHPFCCGIGPGDCRITTHYQPNQFGKAFFGTLHESGHGIYDQGLDPEHYGTPLGSPISLGIHESQSRLWENQVGRSRAFWEYFFPEARRKFPRALGDVNLDEFVFAINDVKPSFIRIEADEATYNLHIILRFEMEQALVNGELAAADVPAAWNEKFEHFFALKPLSDRFGCLQDIHWSMGGIGYFPTYTLGNLYAAQFMDTARRDLPQLEIEFKKGEFGGLKTWLNEKIHSVGQRYRAAELCRRVTGQPLSHQFFLSYLRDKYDRYYGI
jgi:carboxypeptidase Taq